MRTNNLLRYGFQRIYWMRVGQLASASVSVSKSDEPDNTVTRSASRRDRAGRLDGRGGDGGSRRNLRDVIINVEARVHEHRRILSYRRDSDIVPYAASDRMSAINRSYAYTTGLPPCRADVTTHSRAPAWRLITFGPRARPGCNSNYVFSLLVRRER